MVPEPSVFQRRRAPHAEELAQIPWLDRLTADERERASAEIVVSDPLEDHLLTMTLQFGQQVMLGTTSVFLMQTDKCQPVQEYYELAKAGKRAV